MNFENILIIAKGENITFNVSSYFFNDTQCEITFKNGKKYTYNKSNVRIIHYKNAFDPKLYLIKHNGRELFDISSIKEFLYDGLKIWRIKYSNGKINDYEFSSLEISKSVLDDKTASNCLHYLGRIADLNDLTDDNGNKILSAQYSKLTTVYNDTVLARYLNPNNKDIKIENSISTLDKPITPFFPFGCNSSQYKSVKNALSNSLSIIEGPPGTGKTQTILNIIANLVINNKNVQVVSNNNSATDNVFEKMSKSKYCIDFIAARLGSKTNKELFIEKQNGKYPSFDGWKYSGEENLTEIVKKLSAELESIYEKQQLSASLKLELSEISTEFDHYIAFCKDNKIDTEDIKIRRLTSSDKVLKLLRKTENSDSITCSTKIKGLLWGIGKRNIYKHNAFYLASALRYAFYISKISELNKQLAEISRQLEKLNSKEKENQLKEKSLLVLKNYLYDKYSQNVIRDIYTNDDIFQKPQEFLKEYPVILSTTFSALNSVNITFDYIIIDESSQADISTGALALCSAKNAVIVGDSCQLPFVLSDEKKSIAKDIFKKYNLSNAYDFSSNSFIDSVKKVFTDAPVTILREHYRCNPKIIEFCNQKFYNNQLLIMTEESNDSPLSVIKTVSGDHARGKFNQRQIDVIVNEVLPFLEYSSDEIGIIAPYNEQINKLIDAVNNDEIKISTVHKFQGREKKVIIFCTVDNQIREFVDDPKLLNVAISRAENKFILVTGNDDTGDNNISDLISYIEYNNFDISNSNIYSVFDLLYEANSKARCSYLAKHKRISEYDSENIMYAALTDEIEKHQELSVATHVPLSMIIRDKSSLNEKEMKYVLNPNTHVDFLIYSKVSKKPVLIIEVDGFNYHREGTQQAKRDKMKDDILSKYKLKYMRLSTAGSEEIKKIKSNISNVSY